MRTKGRSAKRERWFRKRKTRSIDGRLNKRFHPDRRRPIVQARQAPTPLHVSSRPTALRQPGIERSPSSDRTLKYIQRLQSRFRLNAAGRRPTPGEIVSRHVAIPSSIRVWPCRRLPMRILSEKVRDIRAAIGENRPDEMDRRHFA